MRTAARCALDKGTSRLGDHLFANNPLILADRNVINGLAGISIDGGTGGTAASLDHYQQIVNGIQSESDLVASSGGAWMRPDGPSLGTAFDRLVAQVGRVALLGPDAADRLRTDTNAALSAFRATSGRRFDAPDSGVRWDAKESHFVLSPDRIALRDALTNLMNQPFMSAPRGRTLPAAVPGSVFVWDTTQLDQITALADVRKRYLTDGLAHVAPNSVAALQSAVDAQFVAVTTDQLAGAVTVTPVVAGSDADVAGFQAAIPRLLKIAAFLDELGAHTQANAVRAIMSVDAMEHLGGLPPVRRTFLAYDLSIGGSA